MSLMDQYIVKLEDLVTCSNCFSELTISRINGEIPKEISNLIEFEVLALEFNRFSGVTTRIEDLVVTSIPNHQGRNTPYLSVRIFNISGLREIDLLENNLSGSLPPNMCSFIPNIEELYLSSLTNLFGTIPHSISNYSKLTILDLGIFWCLCKTRFYRLDQGNNLLFLDLSGNNLAGSIPTAIGNLRNLQRFDLSNNKLTGFVGDHICKLQHLGDIYLDQNQLSGSLPNFLWNINSLRRYMIAKSGEIPSGGPFKNLSSQFFIYNEALCGSSRFSVPPCPTSSTHKSNRKKILVLFLLLGNALVVVPCTFIFFWIWYRKGKRAPQQADSLSAITRERISYYELIQATDALSESNLIGSGSFGSVYKGVLRSGTSIVVKVFNLQLDAAFKSFDTECEVLRSLRNRNLVKVITSCSNLDFKALVLEYMPNGSLEKYLYSHNYFLDIMQRLSIMIDVACALEYLHHGCSSPVTHYDLKPSNVLLDVDMVAHLSDFGTPKLLGDDESELYTKTIASLGYIAPGAYGIMFLETFTRRKPSEFAEDLSLKQWVSYSLPDAVIDVAYANLVPPTDNHVMKKLDCVASIIKVALDCCAESPARQTNMKDVVGMLQKIRIQLLAC
ncbi:hypothetical protein P3S68_002884 [Capsicum galapagoense]